MHHRSLSDIPIKRSNVTLQTSNLTHLDSQFSPPQKYTRVTSNNNFPLINVPNQSKKNFFFFSAIFDKSKYLTFSIRFNMLFSTREKKMRED